MNIAVRSEQDAITLREQMGKTFRERVLPKLDELFSSLVSPDQHLRFDKLEIDLGEIDPINQQELFSERFLAELKEAIEQKLKNATMKRLGKAKDTTTTEEIIWVSSKGVHLFQQCRYFLETGLLPWWSGDIRATFFEKLLLEIEKEPQQFAQQMTSLFEQKPALIKRYLLQFPAATRVHILALVLPDIQQEIKAVLAWAETVLKKPQFKRMLALWIAKSFEAASFSLEKMIEQLFLTLQQEASKKQVQALPIAELTSFKKLRPTLQAQILDIHKKMTIKTKPATLPKKQTENPVQSKSRKKTDLISDRIEADKKEEAKKPDQHHETRIEPTKEDKLEVPVQQKENEQRKQQENPKKRKPNKLAPKAKPPKYKRTDSLEERYQSAKIRQAFAEGVQIQNAGLVLLTPFLSQFLKNIGLVDHKQFKDEASQERAILLSQYLVKSDTDIPEYDLALNKMLCGFPQVTPIAAQLDISDKEKQEVEELLNYAIENWAALKKTSPDLLRSAFLQREGRLFLDGGNWTLQVEQQTHDILLNKIPWGFSLIKLPWMEHFLHVEWGY